MSFEIEGKLHKIFETVSKSETFQTREFVLEIQSGNYPQLIKFQLTQDRCELVDRYNENDTVKVYFDLRGREWNEKYFTNLNAWKIESQDTTEQPPESIPEDFPTEAAPEDPFGDLPF